ncbi:hypothetical protein FNF27_05442 [Cafeteria roenbergensis]|uniref:Transcription factor Pcc1 n=1 Tax=Cafeteria roenbergensis TaxID=33653 RepID=A0A5A8DR59_CAFRO|nr:hypothetical protein FNF29_05983 [Cafeteria roenbergensis]KAA0166105.1 hypothetical protein FNF28_03273 [Cafeteria roenbergensis]KAA0167127.1 hypothetical protein FNF31_01013 [Cafeteria roenbergensis]KAA0173093.1 hypothetical protein FNF27_05442 [Cafeteria roenbergensis]|eukprot:KAA0149430.1 hypothetical protein FNF29_05983 [Cafeteria roenbergensis]
MASSSAVAQEAAAKPHSATLRVAFRSPGAATMAKRSLEVDEELRPEAVDCSLSVDGSDLVFRVEGVDERAIRLKLSSQLDMLGVVARTLREFGDEAVSRG